MSEVCWINSIKSRGAVQAFVHGRKKINQIHWVNGEHFIHQAIYTTFGFGSLALNIKLLIRNVIHIEKKSFDPRLMLLCSCLEHEKITSISRISFEKQYLTVIIIYHIDGKQDTAQRSTNNNTIERYRYTKGAPRTTNGI